MTNAIDANVMQARAQGYIEISTTDDPIRLGTLMDFMLLVFPGYTLNQLAITQSDDFTIVIAPNGAA